MIYKTLENYHVLYGLSQLLHPKSYMEIGVREGASLYCVLVEEKEIVDFVMNCLRDDRTVITDEIIERLYDSFTINKDVELFLFDDWSHEMGKGGEARLKILLNTTRPTGKNNIISGDSKETIPTFLANYKQKIDLVFVDGDHSREGAWLDLMNVKDSFKVLVFHDLYHPQHRYLEDLFLKYVRFLGYPYFIVGRKSFGVGVVFNLW